MKRKDALHQSFHLNLLTSLTEAQILDDFHFLLSEMKNKDDSSILIILRNFRTLITQKCFLIDLLPGDFYSMLMDLAFNSPIQDVTSEALRFIEILNFSSYKALNHFLELNFLELAIQAFVSSLTFYVPEHLAFAIVSAATSSQLTFKLVIESDFYNQIISFLLDCGAEDPNVNWMMTCLQQIVSAKQFNTEFPPDKIISICLRFINEYHEATFCAFEILSNFIQMPYEKHLIDSCIADNLVQSAKDILQNTAQQHAAYAAALYLCNVICSSPEYKELLNDDNFHKSIIEKFPNFEFGVSAIILKFYYNLSLYAPLKVFETGILPIALNCVQNGSFSMRIESLYLIVSLLLKINFELSISILQETNLISVMFDMLFSEHQDVIFLIFRFFLLLLRMSQNHNSTFLRESLSCFIFSECLARACFSSDLDIQAIAIQISAFLLNNQ